MLDALIRTLEGEEDIYVAPYLAVKCLKFLKDRIQSPKQWKPSNEQVKAVKEAACYSSVFGEKTIDNLISLSKDLKKLREE